MNEIERQKVMDLYWERYRQKQEEAKAEQADYDAQKYAYQTNYGNDAAQGAQIGGAVGGPWGALGGLIIGGLKGMGRAYNARKENGQGSSEAFWRTVGDVGNAIPDFQQAAPAAKQIGDSASQEGGWKNPFAKKKSKMDDLKAQQEDEQRRDRLYERWYGNGRPVGSGSNAYSGEV